jgi:hypothetical protein
MLWHQCPCLCPHVPCPMSKCIPLLFFMFPFCLFFFQHSSPVSSTLASAHAHQPLCVPSAYALTTPALHTHTGLCSCTLASACAPRPLHTHPCPACMPASAHTPGLCMCIPASAHTPQLLHVCLGLCTHAPVCMHTPAFACTS